MPKLDLIAPEKLSPAVCDAIESAPFPGLADAPKCTETFAAIERLLGEQTTDHLPPSPPAVAGLWLLAGELDRSHDISQTLDSPTGSYWHGIMHRREGDFSNARYWMRRAGGHPVFEELASQLASVAGANAVALISSQAVRERVTRSLTEPHNVAISLIDACELYIGSTPKVVSELQLIYWWEWQLLFRHSM